MKTSEFITAVAQEEEIIREARHRLSELNRRAIKELCPISPGDTLLPDKGAYLGREMVAEHISIVAPVFNDAWVFRISGRVKDSPDDAVAFIPFPEG